MGAETTSKRVKKQPSSSSTSEVKSKATTSSTTSGGGDVVQWGSTSTSIASPFNVFGKRSKLSVPPLIPKDLTASDILQHIPDELKKSNTLTSFSHLLVDLLLVGLFFSAATRITSVLPPSWQWLAWALYWYAQGCVMTGVWVIAHECGHRAFSPSLAVNDMVGWVLHSALLVPYHSWRISHRNHHSNTCSMEHDEVFVPIEKKDFKQQVALALSETPLATLWFCFVTLVLGWPGYLLANFSGPKKYSSKPNSHFAINSALFCGESAYQIFMSDVGMVGALAAIYFASQAFGFQAVAAYYLVPYLVVNFHLVLITFLQHTDTYIPHYRSQEFTFMRGALSTVDRSFGWLLDHTFHHISDTHVMHHLYYNMPFYNAVKATKIIRDKLGPFYLRDDTPIPLALWNSASKCKFVEDEGDIVFYKNSQGAPSCSS